MSTDGSMSTDESNVVFEIMIHLRDLNYKQSLNNRMIGNERHVVQLPPFICKNHFIENKANLDYINE